jgi:phosphotransferase system enzyme I (PtsP)
MAGAPLDALALVALGFRTLSMSAAGIGPVRAAIRSATLSELESFVRSRLMAPQASLRESLRAFALDRGLAV